MNVYDHKPLTPLGQELERALQEWLAASRRALDPRRQLRDLRAEQAAWGRVQSALSSRSSAVTAA